MKRLSLICTALFATALFAGSAPAALLTNGGFEDTDMNGSQGDDWGSFGSAGFNAFFGANGHASFFLDNPGNSGGIFQTGIIGSAGTEYVFSLDDVLIETNAAADTFNFGLEFYAGDDSTQISNSVASLTPLVSGSGLSFTHTATAPAGTVFVRPVILFSDADGSSAGQENVFVFGATLNATAVPEPASLGLFAMVSCAAILRRRR